MRIQTRVFLSSNGRPWVNLGIFHISDPKATQRILVGYETARNSTLAKPHEPNGIVLFGRSQPPEVTAPVIAPPGTVTPNGGMKVTALLPSDPQSLNRKGADHGV